MRILIGGDIALTKGYEKISESNDLFGDVIEYKTMNKVDFLIGNLEAPLTYCDNKILKSGPAIKSSPNSIKQFKGFNLLTLSNNHILDYGEEGLKSTIEQLNRLKLDFTGISINGEFEPKKLTTEGQAAYIVSMSEQEFNQSKNGYGASPLCLLSFAEKVKAIRSKHINSPIIAIVHGGTELCEIPNPTYRKQCKLLIELGASIVVGHHSHAVSGIEYHNGKPIVYSLGNFLFDSDNECESWSTGSLVDIEFDEHGSLINLIMLPVYNRVDCLGVKFHSGDRKKYHEEMVDNISQIISDENKYIKKWSDFALDNFDGKYARLALPFWFKGAGLIFRKCKLSWLWTRRSLISYQLNIIRCPAHRQVLITELERRYEELN